MRKPALVLLALVVACSSKKPRAVDVDASVEPEVEIDASLATPTDAEASQADASADAEAEAETDASDAAADASHDAGRVVAVTRDAGPVEPPLPPAAECQAGMIRIDDFCIDQFEAYVVLLDAAGHEQPHSPYDTVDGLTVRAKVARGVVPQAYISQVQSRRACRNAGKRLCKKEEFELACLGPETANEDGEPSERGFYPYGGRTKQKNACNEGHGSMVPKYYGTDPWKWTYQDFNDPRLNREGLLAKTGAFERCVSPYKVYDLVGNLHEWGDDGADSRGHGRFRGGFYGDAEVNGPGCKYVTKAHELTYHDYSTGFRCCMDVLPAPSVDYDASP